MSSIRMNVYNSIDIGFQPQNLKQEVGKHWRETVELLKEIIKTLEETCESTMANGS